MTLLIICVAIGVLITGFIARYFANDVSAYSYVHIDNKEFGIGAGIILVVILPIIWVVGSNLSIAQQLRYQEFYNGIETEALEYVRVCNAGRSGSSASSGRSNCDHVYDCGSYSWTETTYNAATETWETTTRWADIYCPYLTHEYEYEIHDSLPDGEYRFPRAYSGPESRAWDPSIGIPNSIPEGPPREWLEARERLDANDPRGVTRLYDYDNFILAAEEDLLLPYSEDIDRYLEAGLLPEHTQDIMSEPLFGFRASDANKMQFVNVSPREPEALWQEYLQDFNGALGMTLRGDLRIVAINANDVTSPVNYIEALKAYWIGPDFERRAIAKNAIIVVLGIDDNEVVWAEATTGMPFGNDVMLENISGRFNREAPEFSIQEVLGDPTLTIQEELILSESPGILEQIIFEDFPFSRASMSCSDDDDGGCVGFSNLVNRLEPSTGTKIAMFIVAMLASGVLWLIAANVEFFDRSYSQNRRRSYHEY